MISLKLKVLLAKPVGEVWMTMFEVTDQTGEEAVLPQHLFIYSEGELDLKVGQRTSLKLYENADLEKGK